MAIDNKTIMIAGALVAIIAIAAAAVLVTNNNSSSNDKVTYYGNGGTYDGKDSIESTNTSVQMCPFTREGYAFKIWNTKQDGSGTDYEMGATVKLGTKLYAQWTQNVPTVTFDPNKLSDYFHIFVSGTGMPEKNIDAGGKVTVTTDFTMTLRATEGFSFCALNYEKIFNVYNDTQFKAAHLMFDLSLPTAQIGVPVISEDGKTVTMQVTGIDASQPLVIMKYNFNNYNQILLNGNGGKTAGGDGTYKVLESIPAPDGQTIFTKAPEGKSWSSWNTKNDGSGTTVNTGGSIHVGMVYYAIWQ